MRVSLLHRCDDLAVNYQNYRILYVNSNYCTQIVGGKILNDIGYALTHSLRGVQVQELQPSASNYSQ